MAQATGERLPAVWLLVGIQGAVSAASLVVEIVAGRMLAPYVGMSLYTWTSVIAVVLAGFSAGHWAGGRIAELPAPRALRLTAWAMALAALSTAGAVFALRAAAGPVLGGIDSLVAGIVLLSAVAFFLPSFFAGVPAPVLAQIAVVARPAQSGRALGAIFAASALGAIAGTLAAGFVFISWLGSVGTLAAVTAVYGVLAAVLLAGRARWPLVVLAGIVPLALAGAALARPDPCTVESDYFCIRVIDRPGEDGGLTRLMVLDHLVHGISSRDAPQEQFTYHAAVLDALARARMGARPFAAYFIGGGTYSIPRAWAARGLAADVTVAEIDPAVTQTAIDSFWFDPATARILPQDARRALAEGDGRYDVIVGDAFTDIAVPAHLVSDEFFALVADRLDAQGIYLMNVIDHADRLDALSAIVRTLQTHFPVVEVWADPDSIATENRQVFILMAGQTPTGFAALAVPGGQGFRTARLSQRAVDRLIAQRDPPILTDDYSPIDRLIGTGRPEDR
ncbi:MAG: fused MFS/spermidine synthase [Rhodobacteraceae bacterium]|nr:fused MFS/spermidine synthase [Paracoccaceae bacterium]